MYKGLTMSKEEIKAQFDSIVEQLKGELSTLPESISLLVNLLIATFNMLFELTANQFDSSMKASIDSLKQIFFMKIFFVKFFL